MNRQETAIGNGSRLLDDLGGPLVDDRPDPMGKYYICRQHCRNFS
jgi:hypothetical protein